MALNFAASNEQPFSGLDDSSTDDDSLAVQAINCPFCKNVYRHNRSLKYHVSKAHPSQLHELQLPRSKVKSTLKEYEFKCSECGKQFNQSRNLLFHQRKDHCTTPYAQGLNMQKCPLCEGYFLKGEILLHVEEQHEIKLEKEVLEFQTFDDFQQWKGDVEKETRSKFVQRRGCKRTKSDCIYYFVCHRSGYYVTKSKGHRHLKTQGSNKIAGHCTANMKVVRDENGKCFVEFLKTHVGHKNDLGHLFLSSAERKMIAVKIATKIPLDEILNEIRDNISESKLERIHLLSRKDLNNVERCFHLQSSAMRHSNDAISVDAWVNEMKNRNDCILFYKPQDIVLEECPILKKEDFALIIMNDAQTEMLKKFGSDCICVDDTHGLNAYDFKMVSLLVLDNMRQGFPCAFYVTNRIDEEAISIFFQFVKEKVGSCISSNIFMSDMAPSFWSAWVKIMGRSNHRLFCAWHVDRAWRNNLCKVKGGKEIQAEVYKIARTLLEEKDSATFECIVNGAIKKWLEDEDTREFGSYFKDNYLSNANSWAYCYRLNCGINTNMHLERMHKTIKYIYLHGKNIKRLDKSLHAIMNFLRDKLVDRIIMLTKGKITSKLRDLRNRHKASLKLPKESITKVEYGWNVLSTSGTEIYSIEKLDSNCSCQLVCTYCKTCIHAYSCTCMDSAIKWNMCKHIHLVCEFMKTEESVSTSTIAISHNDTLQIEDFSSDETDGLVSGLKQISSVTSTSSSASFQMRKENLKLKLSEIINSISTDEELKVMENLFVSAAPTLEALRKRKMMHTSHDPIVSTPVNKNIVPQRRLYSTKKASITKKKNIAKPTLEEKQKIALSLILTEKNFSNNQDE